MCPYNFENSMSSCLMIHQPLYVETEEILTCTLIHLWQIDQGPVVQSIVSLTSSLVVQYLIHSYLWSNSQLVVQYLIHSYFCLQNVSSFCKCKSYSHFFSKNISVYAIYNDQSFNDMLTNNIVSFEQLGPGCYHNSNTHSNLNGGD